MCATAKYGRNGRTETVTRNGLLNGAEQLGVVAKLAGVVSASLLWLREVAAPGVSERGPRPNR
jgi:hypothetical protein